MTVRDYRPLEGFDIVPFDVEFDLARAVKATPSSRACATRCGSTGAASRSGRTPTRPDRAEVMAVAEEYFIAEGCGRLTMNMV